MHTHLCDEYTEEEFEALAEVLAVRNGRSNISETARSAKAWLQSWDNGIYDDLIKEHLHGPLEDVPLRINDELFLTRVLALWRLKIAR